MPLNLTPTASMHSRTSARNHGSRATAARSPASGSSPKPCRFSKRIPRCTRWIEAADWIVWQLTGVETRNACTAGYKGIYQDGRHPSSEYLAALNPASADFADTRLAHPLLELGSPAGTLTAQAAQWTGLPEGVVVATGNVDAHVSAPAAGAVESGQMLAVMGTSTCHVMPADVLADVPGICGVVDGGIIAGKYAYEAGQSAVGDIFAWWVSHAVPQADQDAAAARGQSVHQYLSDLGDGTPVGAHGLLALDWMNGNRSILVDGELSGVIIGLTLATRPEEVYRALLESTAFGARRIIGALGESGAPVVDFIVTGTRARPNRGPRCVGPRSGRMKAVRPTVGEAREQLAELHQELVRNALAGANRMCA